MRFSPPFGILALVSAFALLSSCTGGDRSERAVNAPTSTGTPVQRAIDSLLAAGDSVYRQRPESAAVLWNRAHRRASDIGDSARIALALTGQAQAAQKMGDLASARAWGETALDVKRRLGMTSQLFRSLNALGLLAWNEDRLSDATSLFSEAALTARTAGDSSGVAKARMNEGLVLQEQGLFVEARRAYLDASRRFATLGDTVNLARTFNNQAALEIALGQPQLSIRLLVAARRLAAATADSTLELNARGQLAVAHASLGSAQRAFMLIDSATAMARAMKAVPEEAENLRVLGDLYLDAGDARHALDSYRQAAALHVALGQPAERASLIRQQARALQVEGNLSAAQRMARDALRIHRDVGAESLVFEDLLLLVTLARQQGNSAHVTQWLRQLAMSRDVLGSSVARGQHALIYAGELARRAQWDSVITLVTTSSAIDSLVGPDEKAERHLLLARAYAARRDAVRASEEARKAVALVDQVRAQYASGELRARYTDTRARVYAELTVALLREGNVAEAFTVADAARGRSLLELLSGFGDRSSGRASDDENLLLRRIDALVRQLRVREATPARDRSAATVAASAALRDSLRVLRGSYEALRARRGNGNSATGSAATANTAASMSVPLSDMQRRLDEHELLVEYLATPSALVTFVVTRTTARTVSVPVRPEALAMRISLARALMEPQHDATASRALLATLYRDLLAPVFAALPAEERARLQARRAPQLVVVPHGLLAAVPFAALVNESTKRHVVEDWTVLQAPSAATLAALRSTTPRNNNRAGAVGIHAFAPLTTRLPASQAEARTAVRQVGRGSGSSAFENRAASEAQMRATIQQPVMVHFASHAVVNGHNPLFSRLELQPGDGHDGRLEVHELLSLRVRAPLVFLSGCETAVGNVRTTRFETRDEFISLAHAWIIAGARSVIATLWRIDDGAAATFAGHFYDALRSSSAPEALATAQRLMLRDPRTRHPYLWAAYQTIGTHR